MLVRLSWGYCIVPGEPGVAVRGFWVLGPWVFGLYAVRRTQGAIVQVPVASTQKAQSASLPPTH